MASLFRKACPVCKEELPILAVKDCFVCPSCGNQLKSNSKKAIFGFFVVWSIGVTPFALPILSGFCFGSTGCGVFLEVLLAIFVFGIFYRELIVLEAKY